ncbi:MAG: LacI family transcriptional regulator [Oscillospiraceae bacterium]|jgi:DNA-binding LacI/PurR family transcriptional regulator|nr:LacI family transcriptional regulator [Oscillospiraceae bacterium]
MSATIRELSRRCGLSISSVSKALNNYPDVRAETRAMVHRTALEIGYFPNALARGLKTNRTYNLGVLLDDELGDNLSHTFFSAILNEFRRAAERQGYDITLINRNMGDRPLSYLNHCKHRQLDGICLLCVDFANQEVLELTRSDVISVSIDHPFPGIAGVNSDNREGMRQLVRHAVRFGHTKIAYMHGTSSFVTDVRVAAFREAMEEAGVRVNEDWMVSSHYHSAAHAFEEVRRLLPSDDGGGRDVTPTCILMTDDISALGAMEAIRLMGLRIPQDISVAGFDGSEVIQRMYPRITTVQQNTQWMGTRAAELLLERIENPAADVPPIEIAPVTLIEGETVGRLG